MNRRNFLAAGVGGAMSVPLAGWPAKGNGLLIQRRPQAGVRDLFPRLQREAFLNAAGGTPLSTFAEEGLRSHEDMWRWGRGDGRGEAFGEMLTDTRARFAQLIGARPSEISFVQCTKAGEQIVLDSVDSIKSGGSIVTNDLHFNGSLHNLIGLKKAGRDVRIVRARDWRIDLAEMEAAIDKKTALVTVTLVSNINGHVEDVRALSDIAHRNGALIFAVTALLFRC